MIISIIGGGFSGTMTAIHCLKNAKGSIKINIIDNTGNFATGIAYNPYSKKHLLNVITSKMSAFPDKSDDFLNWVISQSEFLGYDKEVLSNSFLPRYYYGQYLKEILHKEIQDNAHNAEINLIQSDISDINYNDKTVVIKLGNGAAIESDYCVLATGNSLPKNPVLNDNNYIKSNLYFQNPWVKESVSHITSTEPVMILGNGLTMVDTVLGLIENGFNGKIYSLSPHGFNILPHRHNGLKYSLLTNELKENLELNEIVKLILKHIKMVRELGVSAEPVIDSLRPYTQQIWKNLTLAEKKKFMNRYRHLWGVARHRIPLHIHDKLQALRIGGKLEIISGRLEKIEEKQDKLVITYFDKHKNSVECIEVQRFINCTGPDSDFSRIENNFLSKLIAKGTLQQDALKLGVNTNTETFETIDINNKSNQRLFAIGSLLRGMLWETTAVNELRTQAEKVAKNIINKEFNNEQ